MANVNVKGTPTALLNTRLWAGSPQESTDWLQSPIGSNSAVGAMSMAVIEVVIDDRFGVQRKRVKVINLKKE